MIDLHSHILPGLDDGAKDPHSSLQMARIAVADGITHMACTPNIEPGRYENDARGIATALEDFRLRLLDANIALEIAAGADAHIAPDLDRKLAAGEVPTLNQSRYFLFEPPHHIRPPKIEEFASRLIKAGFLPIITHPERLTWTRTHYEVIERLNRLGCLIQLTADSITGGFGRNAQNLAYRMLDEGRVDIIATDCHGPISRTPVLSGARRVVADRLNEGEASAMVFERPSAIWSNRAISAVGAGLPEMVSATPTSRGLFGRLFGGRGD
jgi:protein-tyrosine phosphatase